MAIATAPKRASIHALGCRLNQSEAALIREKLEGAGYEIVPFGEPAEVGIVNTCTVTREADAKSRKVLRSFARKNPHAVLAVVGCYAQLGAAAIAKIDGVDIILGNEEKLNVVEYVAAGKRDEPLILRDRILRDDFTIDVNASTPLSRRANLKIQDGCDFMCSFCVIPFARGRARSRRLDNLLDEARQLVERGTKEIVLTGVNVGLYAYEGNTIAEVVDRLNEIDGLERIRISSIEPTTIPHRLFESMNDPGHTLVPFLHIPMQSGSNNVLRSMRRRYTAEEFAAFVHRAHEAVEDLCIGTDILVGMPGETEEDFEATCALLASGPIAYAHVFKYSERPGTASVRHGDKIPPEIMNRRSARVRALSARIRGAFYSAHLGRRLPVLFEHHEDGCNWGYTENYIRVAVPSDDIVVNQIRDVTLQGLCGDYVQGRCEDPIALEMCL